MHPCGQLTQLGLAKQGDNLLGSICLSVHLSERLSAHLSVRLSVLSRLNR